MMNSEMAVRLAMEVLDPKALPTGHRRDYAVYGIGVEVISDSADLCDELDESLRPCFAERIEELEGTVHVRANPHAHWPVLAAFAEEWGEEQVVHEFTSRHIAKVVTLGEVRIHYMVTNKTLIVADMNRRLVVLDGGSYGVAVELFVKDVIRVAARRTTLAVHASAVSIDGMSAAFVGRSGAGKSTTALALALDDRVSYIANDRILIRRLVNQHVAVGWPNNIGVVERTLQLLGLLDESGAPKDLGGLPQKPRLKWIIKRRLAEQWFGPQFEGPFPLRALVFPRLNAEVDKPTYELLSPEAALGMLFPECVNGIDARWPHWTRWYRSEGPGQDDAEAAACLVSELPALRLHLPPAGDDWGDIKAAVDGLTRVLTAR